MKFHYNQIQPQQQQKEKEEEEEAVRLGQKNKLKKTLVWEGGGKVVVDDKDSEICCTWTLSLSLSLSLSLLSLFLSCEILDQQVLTAAHL
jgi:hypothetical protein